MPRYIAFLRGMNLGKRRIKMDALRALFEEHGFENVSTYIASGNVIFDTPDPDEAALKIALQAHLADALGYQVGVYLRTMEELRQTIAAQPFPASELEDPAHSVLVTFLDKAPPKEAEKALAALRTERDEFAVIGRESYWLSRGRLSDSSVDMSKLEKATGAPGTMRNLRTLVAIAEKYGNQPG